MSRNRRDTLCYPALLCCPMEGFDAVRVSKLLKLPSDAETVMVVGAGQRAPDGVYYPQMRFERERFVFEV